MNILLYFPNIDKSNGGIYQYTFALVKLVRNDLENRYYLLCRKSVEIEQIIQDHDNLILVESSSLNESIVDKRIKKLKKIFNRVLKKISINHNLRISTKLDEICRQYAIDIVHSPTQTIPDTIFPKIVTLHDVQELHFPEFFSSSERMWRSVNYKKSIDNADLVIVSYDHIKKDIVKYFDKAEAKVQVVLLEMDNLWFSEFENKKIRSIDNISNSKPYILYPASTWAHKNHLALLEALKILIDKGIALHLVCTGHLTSHFSIIEKKIDELQLRDNVKFLGVVDDEILYGLYKNSIGVVVPTLYEAGSFPLMESILMGIPVICSNVTSLPETIGSSDYTFDPIKVTEIANMIELLVQSEAFRNANVLNSLKRAKHLTNTNALAKIKDIYIELNL